MSDYKHTHYVKVEIDGIILHINIGKTEYKGRESKRLTIWTEEIAPENLAELKAAITEAKAAYDKSPENKALQKAYYNAEVALEKAMSTTITSTGFNPLHEGADPRKL